MTRTEGNVIHADFGHRILPDMSFTCETLFQDQYAMLMRLTYRVGDRVFIQHIASGVGLDD